MGESREYELNFGIVKIIIDGTTCTGTYQNNGEFSGTINGDLVKAKWTNEGIEGLIELDLSGNKLVGKWKQGLEAGAMRGSWEGILIESKSSSNSSNFKEGVNYNTKITFHVWEGLNPIEYITEKLDKNLWNDFEEEDGIEYNIEDAVINKIIDGDEIIIEVYMYLKYDAHWILPSLMLYGNEYENFIQLSDLDGCDLNSIKIGEVNQYAPKALNENNYIELDAGILDEGAGRMVEEYKYFVNEDESFEEWPEID